MISNDFLLFRSDKNDMTTTDALRKRLRARARSTLILVTLLLIAGGVQARDYQIEVVLFEHVNGRDLTAGGLFYPRVGRSVRLGTEQAIAADFRPLEQNLSLADDAADIAASRRYRLIRHLAWRQPGLPRDDAIAVRISLGNTIPVYLSEQIEAEQTFIPASAFATPERTRQINTSTLNGSILVHLGRFLHMETRLVFTDENTGQSFRLAQSRKMRSRELHYIDNPRFGLLTRILPIEEDEETAPAQQAPNDDPDPEPVSTEQEQAGLIPRAPRLVAG